MPRVAWLVGRAFGTRLPAWIPGIVWSALLWPARMMGAGAVWVLGGVVFVAPATGPIRASVTLAPSSSWSRRVVVRWLAVLALLVLVMVPFDFLAGFGVLAAFGGLEGVLLVADYFLISRDRPRGGGAGQPSADLTVGQLAAWPMGQGDGSALMAAVLADLDESWPGAVLCLQPANQRVVDLVRGAGFPVRTSVGMDGASPAAGSIAWPTLPRTADQCDVRVVDDRPACLHEPRGIADAPVTGRVGRRCAIARPRAAWLGCRDG